MNTQAKSAQLVCDILLVDNKKVSRDMVQRLLEHAGYQVVTAEHGQEAVSILSQSGFACRLVITETVMPYIDGFDLIRFIRSASMLPVMVLSSSGDEQTVREVFRLQADEFMKKPFMSGELLQRVRQLLARPVPAQTTFVRSEDFSEVVRTRAAGKKKVLREGDPVAIRLAS